HNRSFGLTTMRDHHVDVSGTTLKFSFQGKSGKRHGGSVGARRRAKHVKWGQDLPGQQIFQYLDEAGEARDIDSSDVNDYVREAAGADFTAKDIRTWAGTVRMLDALERRSADPESATAAKGD